MIRIIILFPFIFSLFSPLFAEYTIANGNWSSGSTWSLTPGGIPCNCVPDINDPATVAVVEHNVLLDIDLDGGNKVGGALNINKPTGILNGLGKSAIIKSSGTFTVEGGGSVYIDNFESKNGSFVYIGVGSAMTVSGTFHNSNNNGPVWVDGTLNVAFGGFINGNNAEIVGSGTLLYDPLNFVNNGTIHGLDDGSGTFTLINPLKVSLTDFYALNEERVVIFHWETATEINSAYFILEKSIDGKTFQPMARITSAGNSSETSQYAYSDNNPENTLVYYRLSEVDMENNSVVLKTIAVDRSGVQENFMLFPNQLTFINDLYLQFPRQGNYSITLLDISGRALASAEKQILYAGQIEGNVFNQNLSKGIYIIHIKDELQKVSKALKLYID